MTKVKRRKAPPSRIRYEQSHPAVSFRVPRDIYDRIRQTKNAGGNSFADIFMAGLGKMEAQAKKLEQSRKKGYDEGYQKGYAEARLRYRVTYNCNICGEVMEVKSKEEKEAVTRYMQEKGWAHLECLERRRSSLS